MLLKALCHLPTYAQVRVGDGTTKTLRIMKLTGILLVAAAVHVSAGTRAQTVTYSAKTTPLVSVFAAIEQQTGYVFFYNSRDLQGARPVTVQLEKTPLKEALERVLSEQPLSFDIQGNTIVITPKTVVGVNTNNGAAPPGEIHGRITDSLGKPLEGVNITVKGTRKGTTTGSNGEFNLKGVNGEATLLISSIGYESQEIRLEGRQDVHISLREGASSLDETVIKGYYSTTKRLNTGDVTTVKGEDITKQPVSDPILALEGRVPGLFIQQSSGVPGAYSIITIRGQNSIANGSYPLYIIDGVPYSSLSPTSPIWGGGALGVPGSQTGNTGGGASPFNDLNPAEIENIEVLKDADATAIYGSRGANGVILITTKKGKAGRTQFDLNAFSGEGKVTRRMPMLNTPEYLEMRHEAFRNDGKTPGATDYDINGVWDTTRYTDWQKVLIGNNAQFSNIQGTLSGGNVNTQFLIGAGYSYQGTVFPGNYSDQKVSVNMSLTHSSLDQRLHTQLSASYLNENSKLPQTDFTSQITLAPDAPPIYNPNGSLNWQPVSGYATFPNPLAATLLNAKAITNNLISNFSLSYLLFPGLQLKSSFGYNDIQGNSNLLTPASYYAPPYNNNAAYRANDFGTTDSKTWIIEPQIGYEKLIAQGKLNVLLGSTFQQNTMNVIGYGASGFTSDALISDPLAATTKNLAGYSNILYRYNAFFGRVNYDWREKYLLNITARRDGSSRFGPSRQFGNFGAIGAGWVFSKEKFVAQNFSFLSFGKLRASYGSTGNDQIVDYQYLSTYTPLSYSYEGITGLYPTRLSNAYFGWEIVKKLEGGVELGFLRDRIVLAMNYYRNRSGNQLVGYPLPLLTGFGTIQENMPAVVQNSGGEITLNTVNIRSSAFTWSTSINLSIPRNKLVSYPNLAASAYANTYVVGQSLFIKKEYHVTGINDSTGKYQYASSKGGSTYQPVYPTDLKVTKPITNQYYGGIDNSLKYKGFELDVLVQVVKQTGLNFFASDIPSYAGIFDRNFPTAMLQRWQKPGDVAKYGKSSTTRASDPLSDLFSADYFISDASFVRLKNLLLSYTLSKNWLREVHFQNARIYIQCQNLFTITKYLGLDPEAGGIHLPPLRMITGGLQITL
jgi:TonB-linked SusC/RagA family outer membrane protein